MAGPIPAEAPFAPWPVQACAPCDLPYRYGVNQIAKEPSPPMSQKQIDAILWRKYLTATSHAVWGVSSSQYYFELPDRGYEQFLGTKCSQFKDNDGNQAYKITLESFEGVPSAAPRDVTFAKKRPGAHREGNWTVDSIRDGTGTAYDLWRKSRGPAARYEQLPPAEKEKNYIIIVRDIDGLFHGRWIRGSDFDALPTRVREALASENAGWRKL